MTSPYPIAITVEMFYDGVWNDITVDTRQTTDITMRWGRADEASAAAPNELAGVTLNNGVSRVVQGTVLVPADGSGTMVVSASDDGVLPVRCFETKDISVMGAEQSLNAGR